MAALNIQNGGVLFLDDYKGSVNLHLGCGGIKLEGFVNVDFYNKSVADLVFDLNGAFPFPADHADLIFLDNVLEHIPDQLEFMKECIRILKPGGYFIARVPYFKSKHAFVDPTHVKFFTIQSLDYYVRDRYFHKRYGFFPESFSDLQIGLDLGLNSFLRRYLAVAAIKWPNWFENSVISSLFVFHNITYVARK